LFVKVNWRIPENQSPFLFSRKAQWAGVRVAHWRVLAGEMPEHTDERHEVNVTLAGNLVTERQTAAGSLRRCHGAVGNLCMTPAGQPIAAEWEDEFECLSISIEPVQLAHTAISLSFPSSFELAETTRRSDPLIQHIGLALVAEENSGEPSGRLYTDSLTQTLLLHLLKNYTTANSIIKDFNGKLPGYKLRRVTEFIHANLQQDLSLAEIAEVAELSQFHFARAFRRTTGLTPQQYLTKERIERAKQLLANGDLPLVEISLQTGFKNQSHFTTLFRKFTTLTPKAFRELKHA
jgi:AraC family transcriptional regulator